MDRLAGLDDAAGRDHEGAETFREQGRVGSEDFRERAHLWVTVRRRPARTLPTDVAWQRLRASLRGGGFPPSDRSPDRDKNEDDRDDNRHEVRRARCRLDVFLDEDQHEREKPVEEIEPQRGIEAQSPNPDLAFLADTGREPDIADGRAQRRFEILSHPYSPPQEAVVP